MKRKKNGFTIIELIVVLAITPIVVTAIYKAMLFGYHLLENGTRLSNVQEECKAMIDDLSEKLKTSRSYKDTIDTNSDTRFSALPDTMGTKVCYIEGYDGKRYLYTFKTVGTTKELHQYTWDTTPEDQYEIKTVTDADGITTRIVETVISQEQYKIYQGTSADPGYDIYVSDRFPVSETSARIPSLTPQYQNGFLLYDSFDWSMYLIANDVSKGQYVKVALVPKDVEASFDPSECTDKIIMKDISEIQVVKDSESTNYKKCTIRVKAVENGKIKELKTDVYVFEKI